MVSQIPRSLRQVLQRLPVGHSVVYFNELHPKTQTIFLIACMQRKEPNEPNEPPPRDALHVHDGTVRLVPSTPPAPDLPPSKALCSTRSHSRPNWRPVPHPLIASLHLPKPFNGAMCAYRAAEPAHFTRPELFLLAVPQDAFTGARSVEEVLRDHLYLTPTQLRWRRRSKHAHVSATLEALGGFPLAAAQGAAWVAAQHGRRLFLLGRGKQRVLAGAGPMLRELGRWCPAAFRSFHVDLRAKNRSALDGSELSGGAPLRALLESAMEGFRHAQREEERDASSLGVSADGDGKGRAARFEPFQEVLPAFAWAVAEVLTDPKRDAAVHWADVRDDPLCCRLFEVLHDPTHYCVVDALLHATHSVLWPFLTGEREWSAQRDASCVGGSCLNGAATSSFSVMPLFWRWSALRRRLRWRFFEPVFGSLSQLVRPESVAAVGSGFDPFIIPLHEGFVRQTLLPQMRLYYKHNSSHMTETDARMATVDILECFNTLATGFDTRRNETDSIKTEHTKTIPKKGMNDHTVLSKEPFTLEDLPALLKYLFYFSEHFEVVCRGTHVRFGLYSNDV